MKRKTNGRLPFKHQKPSEKDFAEVASLQYQIAQGNIEGPEVRLVRQLEEMLAKWDRLLGAAP